MFEWRKIWTNGLPNEGRSPKSRHQMAAEGVLFPWRLFLKYDFHGFGCHLGNVGLMCRLPA